MQLSKLENLAFEKLRKNNLFLFKIKDLYLLLGIDKIKAYNIVKSLKKKGVIKKVGKGFLTFKDTDDFVIAVRLNTPSYISFWSALSYYGFSDQMPKKIFVATTKYFKGTEKFKYVTLNSRRFFGYVKIRDIIISEKEKAIIDSLLLPKYSGGVKEIYKGLEKAIHKKEIEINKLVNYGFQIKSKAVLRRLGFLLEKLGTKEKELKHIRKNIGKGYELLEPGLKRQNNLNKKWLLDVNIDL